MTADTTSDAFLQGQGIPVDLPHIESELTKLWGASAEQVGGPDLENPNVTRVVLANLVIESFHPECAALRDAVDAVVARFPCRSIVLHGSDDPARRVAAEVSALCHLPAPGLPQVCSERIVLHAGPNALDLVPGAVRPLLEAELPFVLWWTGDPRERAPIFRDLASEASRLILDLPDPGSSPEAIRLGLDPSLCPHSRDAAWFGITRWRELVAQFFDPPRCVERSGRIGSVHVEAVSPDPAHPPRVAVWLVAWLAGQLGWKSQGALDLSASSSGSALHTAFEGPKGAVAVEIVTKPGATPAVVGVRLQTEAEEDGGDGGETFRLIRLAPESNDVRIEVDSANFCNLPRVVVAPELSSWRRVAAALESSRIDPPYQKALPHALRLMGA
jgi:glucose-6-phosphate dehydrogenase assembly protein OpcA